MIQELPEIVNMFIADVMPEIVALVETTQLSDEVTNIIGLIRCVKAVHRVLETGKRVASRIQSQKRSKQASDEK